MMSRLYKYGVLTLLLVTSAADNSGAEREQAQALWDNYKVVVERNIFSRDRGRAGERAATAAPQAPPRPERYIVLTGVVQRGEELIAFLENTRTGTTSRARIGDAVAQGRLANITLDYVDYESEGQTARIEIGKNLEGGVSAPAIPYEFFEAAGASEVSAAGTSEGEATVSGNEAAILERLRQERERELGQ